MENQGFGPEDGPKNADSGQNGGFRRTLLEKARESTLSPGVYLMKDASGLILYVGKAKNLRNRVSSYFQTVPHEIPRIEMMVGRVAHFDLILTETEAEALILECTLIKKHRPKFNVRLKDDKTYPYLKIQLAEDFPRIQWTRKILRDGARYFGPFPSAYSARQVMGLLTETFELRDCSDNTFRHRSRPCILYQMGKCSGPCCGKISQEGYKESMQEVVKILEGKGTKFIKTLRKGMEDAAANEEYEEAAQYRDQIRNLELITETQGAVDAGSERNLDVAGIARIDGDAHGVIIRIRQGKMIGIEHFHVQNADPTYPDAGVLFDFLSQYYSLKVDLENDSVAKEVLIPMIPEDLDLLEKALGVGILVTDEKNKVQTQLSAVAKANAEYALEQSRKKQVGHGVQALEEIQDKLGLSRLPHRIECYDNSNIQGEDAVASRVVFIDGAPDKNLYRRYKVKTVQGANDFATMKEILGRRFAPGKEEEEELPELVVVDGGKGQLAQAVAIMEELNIQGVAVVGLAKARTESDFTKSEVKSSFERIFIPNRKNPVSLLPHTGAYKLLTHIRDEAHRFAIQYHRLVRSKRVLGSARE
jgi:excinuclease ABC subunit C